MFGGVNVWRIAELKVIGEIKFGEWMDFGHKILSPAKIWLVKVWRITHDSPNSPNFPAAKHSRYTIIATLGYLLPCEPYIKEFCSIIYLISLTTTLMSTYQF